MNPPPSPPPQLQTRDRITNIQLQVPRLLRAQVKLYLEVVSSEAGLLCTGHVSQEKVGSPSRSSCLRKAGGLKTF